MTVTSKLFAALVSIVVTGGITTVRASADGPTALWRLPPGEACDAYCTNCQGGGHATIEGQAAKGLHAQALSCDYPGTCSSHGHTCEAPPPGGEDALSYQEAVVALLDAVRNDDVSGTASLVRSYPSYFSYAPGRDAIQGLDCQGHVVLHVPRTQLGEY